MNPKAGGILYVSPLPESHSSRLLLCVETDLVDLFRGKRVERLEMVGSLKDQNSSRAKLEAAQMEEM